MYPKEPIYVMTLSMPSVSTRTTTRSITHHSNPYQLCRTIFDGVTGSSEKRPHRNTATHFKHGHGFIIQAVQPLYTRVHRGEKELRGCDE